MHCNATRLKACASTCRGTCRSFACVLTQYTSSVTTEGRSHCLTTVSRLPRGGSMTSATGAACRLGVVIATCCVLVAPIYASRPTMDECFEGSDFISNAALSRDAGIAAGAFLERMELDFVAIRDLPRELRWFAHDSDDEAFLLEAVREVFERPASPYTHRSDFLYACLDRIAAE